MVRQCSSQSSMSSLPQEEKSDALYAVVVVLTSLKRRVTSLEDMEIVPEEDDHLTRTFHYHVPLEMREAIDVGQLVGIPFGNRYLQGVVVELEDTSPVEETRDIDQIMDPEPVLSPAQIEMAHWISDYYLAPIQQTIRQMLPPGMLRKPQVIVEAIPDVEADTNTGAQAEILSLVRKRGPLTYRQISRATERDNWRSVVDQLVDHGWVTRKREIGAPRVRPKRIAVVRVSPSYDAEEDYPSDRAPRQQDVLDYLLARKGWTALRQVREETGAPYSSINALEEKGVIERGKRQVWRDPLEGESFVPIQPPALTADQEAVWRTIAEDLEEPEGRPFLLQGVTGSGKTEIYLRAVARVLEQGRGAIVLVPEIALTPQTIRRFGARFPDTIAVMHSRLSGGERYDQWRRLRSGDLRLVVGARSAIFAPISDLGLIVLDEAHEWTYKQQQTPRYHTRGVAVKLAALTGATCIFGSATPDLTSTYLAKRGIYRQLQMPRRIMGHRRILEEQRGELPEGRIRFQPMEKEAMHAPLPPVEVVDMRAELLAHNTSIFSRSLRQEMEAALTAGEQIILFLNRRGNATFVMCRDCGHVLRCPRCDVPLTYHSSASDLICHHCNYRAPSPTQCPECWSRRIKFFGVGTERVEEVMRETYPQARIVRWDLDTTGGKSSHQEILDRFIKGEADVMIGTQMIAKGLDLPRVTLVGVISADTVLNLPDFRAAERTFQLLTQVAGRAGRSILGGKVIVQTYTPEHPAIQRASEHDYEGFYAQEIAFRREHWYPPISRIVKLLYVHSNAQKAEREAGRLHRLLEQRIARLGLPQVDLIGPAPAFFSRLRGKYRWQILVRGKDPHRLLRHIRFPLGWRVDVDPVSVL
ncbi:MAG: primosomal protein N' [Anaerolineales bacterium]